LPKIVNIQYLWPLSLTKKEQQRLWKEHIQTPKIGTWETTANVALLKSQKGRLSLKLINIPARSSDLFLNFFGKLGAKFWSLESNPHTAVPFRFSNVVSLPLLNGKCFVVE
jgi:hypothetical protein